MAGQGNHPFRSSWAFKIAAKHDATLLVHKQIKWGDTDATEQTVFMDWFFDAATPPPGSTGQIKVYIGGTFTAKPVKVYNGSIWVTKPVKYYSGTWDTTNY